MTKELYEEIISALKDRNDWETKQSGFYQLRHKQVRRKSKPYKGAPDQRYGLADSMIEKQKPLYIQQLYVNETIASFIAKTNQNADVTTAAANWFDYQLKQESNFEKTMFIAVDKMLEAGAIPIKAFWNTKRNQVAFDACDPMHIIVPYWTEELQDADWLVHVMHLSEAQYRRNELYTQDDDLIKSIKGRGNASETGENNLMQNRELREGITCGSTSDQIVLWEVYRKDGPSDDAKWVVDTISPLKGWDDTCTIRETFGLPFDHGMLPFFMLRAEIIDKGYFSPRGITEITAPHEASLNKTWNSKLQHLDFHGNPTYKNTGNNTIPNGNNFRVQVGGILPPGIEPVVNPSAPIDFDQEMQFTRALAEDRVSVPDLSASEHLSGKQGGKGQVTATQVNAIVGQSGQSNDMRSRIFRLDSGDGLKMAWAILVQYKKDELAYLYEGEIQQLPSEALHTNYIITPNGSPDSWNKGAQLQKAYARFQMFNGDSFIKQGELRKTVLELDDPRLVNRLFTDPGAELKAQAEQQAQEISIMLLGFQASVDELDDDKTHLQNMDHYVQRRVMLRQPFTPEQSRLFLMHGGEHIEALKTKKDPATRQIEQLLIPTLQILQQWASAPEQLPQNVMTLPPQGAGPTPASPTAGAPAEAPPQDQSDKADAAVKVGNMLANMASKGIPITHAEINPIMQALGLPDLPLTTIAPPKPQPLGAA